MDVLKFLYIEDSKMDANLVMRALRKEGFEVETDVVDSVAGLSKSLAREWDLVISDCHLPLIKVEDALRMVRAVDQNVPFIAVSGAIGEEEAVSLLKSGAQDFVSKNNLSRLAPAIRRELKEAEGRRERVKAERALKESEERFQLAMRASNDGLWDWDIANGNVYFSPRWKAMLGYDEYELDNSMQMFRNLVHPDDLAKLDSTLESVLTGKADRAETEYRMRDQSGDFRHIQSRLFMQSDGERLIRVTGTHADVTRQKNYEQQLQDLSQHLLLVREDEKARIAQAIHDDLGATFTALNMDVHWLASKLPQDQEPLIEKVKSMTSLVSEAAQASNRIVTELRPSLLDDLGLFATIEWQLKEFAQRYDIDCHLDSNVSQINLEKERSVAVFRIFQESLTNIAKHAQAKTVNVILLVRENQLTMQILDDGHGLVDGRAARENSHGVSGMRERARYLGGELVIESEGVDEGVRICLYMPLLGNEEAIS